jgi:hypothetical protein
MDRSIDDSYVTPKDYTICIKNIPLGLDLDYHEHIKNILENYSIADPDKVKVPILVKKIVLVYDIE